MRRDTGQGRILAVFQMRRTYAGIYENVQGDIKNEQMESNGTGDAGEAVLEGDIREIGTAGKLHEMLQMRMPVPASACVRKPVCMQGLCGSQRKILVYEMRG